MTTIPSAPLPYDSQGGQALNSANINELARWLYSVANQINTTSSGAAPTDATYILQTSNTSLTSAQVLSSLSTGYMKVATTTGIVSSQTVPIPQADGGTGFNTYTLGDILYCSASNVLSKLAGNITSTRNFLRQTGTGSVSTAPVWDTLTKTDVGLSNVENTALSTWTGATSITTLGTISTGTWSATAVAVANGGTGSTTASGAQTNLGLIGSTYTPTFTGTANVSVLTGYAAQYMHVGNVVTVSGQFDVTPTVVTTDTQLGISLPVASTLSATNKCAGTAACGTITSASAAIFADTTNNRANVQFKSLNTSAESFFFTFTYLVT